MPWQSIRWFLVGFGHDRAYPVVDLDSRPVGVPYVVLVERVEVEVDAGTAMYLRACAGVRGGSMATVAARQLRGLAVADSARQHAAWAAKESEFFQDAEAERDAALSS